MTPITEDLFTETDRRVSKFEEENGPLPEFEKKALREDIYKQVVQETAREAKFKAQLGMVVASALAKQDIHIVDSAAENAIKNNWLNFVISAGMIAWSAYDAFKTYKELVAEGKTVEEAQLIAVSQFGKEALLALVGGPIANRILGVIKNASAIKKGVKLLDMLIAQNPVLQKIAARLGIVAEKVGAGLNKFHAAVEKTPAGQFMTKVENKVGAALTKVEDRVVNATKKGAQNLKDKVTKPFTQSVEGIATLPAPKMVRHHIFNKFRGQSMKSEKYREFFKKHNINVDGFAIELPESTHRSVIHAAGNNWTTKWKNFIDQNPTATTKEVYQFAGILMDEYNVSWRVIVKYRS